MAMVPHVSQNLTVCFLLPSIVTIQSRNHFTEQDIQFASDRNRLTIHSITPVMKTRPGAKTRWLVTSLIFCLGRCCSTSPSYQEGEPTNQVLQQKFLQPKWSSLQCCAIARSSRTTFLTLERKSPKWESCKSQQLLDT